MTGPGKKSNNDKALLARIKNGELAAFETLVSQYHSKLTAIARSFVGQAFADEIVQDSWEAAIKSIDKFEERSSLSTWLTQIVINRSKTRLKRENRQSSLDAGWQDPDAADFDHNERWSSPPQPWHDDTPEQLLSSEQLRNLISDALENLPENQGAVIRLHDLEGVELNEICNIIDVSQSNVRVLLHRARLTIRKVIDEYQQK
ncbi:MAG: RNA polymerase sigma factor [Gammaproteobacteria bacterium]|nr:RNA polymerase sigma factor [Gammaproteobacteria bacterium]